MASPSDQRGSAEVGSEIELAVDAHGAFERAPVRQDLVGGDDDARDGVAEVLGLLRAEAREHLGVLDVAGAEVVEDDEAADGGLRLLRGRVEEAVSEDAAELQLVVEGAGVGGDGDGGAVGHESQVVAHVVDGLAIPECLGLERREGRARDGLVGAHERGDGGHEPAYEPARGIDGVALVEHEVAVGAGLERDQDGRVRAAVRR